MGRIIGLILGGVAAFNGIAILIASDCESVSLHCNFLTANPAASARNP